MTKPEELPITPGEAEVKSGMNVDVILRHNGTRIDFGDAVYHRDHVANATLYADAHNTYRRTKVLPSVMAERLEEAMDLLQQWVNQRDGIRSTVPETLTREFLTRTKQPEE